MQLNNLNIAICDDDETSLNILSSSIKSLFTNKNICTEISTFRDSIRFKQNFKKKQYDLIFLDIDMPDVDGIEIGKWLRETKKKANLIYVSNREERVFEALKLQPDGFVRKGAFLEDLPIAIDSYLKRVIKKNDIIVVDSFDGLVKIYIEQIKYIEGDGKYQKLVLNIGEKETIFTSKSMSYYEEYLQTKGFYRIHKGYLINFTYVYKVDTSSIVLTDKTALPISRRRVKDTKCAFLEFIKQNSV